MSPPTHFALWIALYLAFGITAVTETNDSPTILVRDGSTNDVPGYPGLAYHAAGFEPLCGNIGTDTRYSDNINILDRCTAAMDVFANDTTNALAIYDSTGTRLIDARVGNGYEICLCFSMQQTGSTDFKGAMCWWVDGSGRGDLRWHLWYDDILAGSYRPNVAKALPQCKDVDVDVLKSSWSASAAQGTATGASKTISPVPSNTNSVRKFPIIM